MGIIAKVRDVYHGQITYDLNHGNEDKIKWLDALDFISISAYHAIPHADGRPLGVSPEADRAVRSGTGLY
jgi:hypothetical protein